MLPLCIIYSSFHVLQSLLLLHSQHTTPSLLKMPTRSPHLSTAHPPTAHPPTAHLPTTAQSQDASRRWYCLGLTGQDGQTASEPGRPSSSTTKTKGSCPAHTCSHLDQIPTRCCLGGGTSGGIVTSTLLGIREGTMTPFQYSPTGPPSPQQGAACRGLKMSRNRRINESTRPWQPGFCARCCIAGACNCPGSSTGSWMRLNL